MNSYYDAFYNALLAGDLERRTNLETGSEAIYRNGRPVASDSQDPVEKADLSERIMLEPHLVLFGAGHVGKALYDLAVLQNMKVTVLDCREELLNKERFPKAQRFVDSYENLLCRDYPGFDAPYYVIFTHGHTYDGDCLYYAARHRHSYIGMIGSRAKVAHELESIHARGITDAELAKLHAPIGLSINAATPEEIAVSIMAEIISVFRADKRTITIEPSILRKAADEGGVMVRIVEKHGSAPRSVGSMLFVSETGLAGTIGGGAIENHAIETAHRMLRDGSRMLIERHTLTGEEDLGMTCGGSNTLLYKLIAN